MNSKDFTAIAETIIALKDADLTLRDKLIMSSKLGKGYHPDMEALHNHNARVLDQIIDSIGYPTIGKVGKEGSEAAWLVIQHSIGQPAFMKKCARLLENAVERQEADATNLAYLADRIAVFENRPQLYGTQFDWDKNGELSPNEFDNAYRVNERRKSIGLNTLEEQTAVIRQQAKLENQSAPSDLESRKKETEEWKIAVGWST